MEKPIFLSKEVGSIDEINKISSEEESTEKKGYFIQHPDGTTEIVTDKKGEMDARKKWHENQG
jgi:hypothetical protein